MDTVSVETSAKVMGMQLRHSLCSSEFCGSCKTKYEQKVFSCAHLSHWEGQASIQARLSEGFYLLLFSTCLTLDSCFAPEISE